MGFFPRGFPFFPLSPGFPFPGGFPFFPTPFFPPSNGFTFWFPTLIPGILKGRLRLFFKGPFVDLGGGPPPPLFSRSQGIFPSGWCPPGLLIRPQGEVLSLLGLNPPPLIFWALRGDFFTPPSLLGLGFFPQTFFGVYIWGFPYEAPGVFSPFLGPAFFWGSPSFWGF